VVDVVAGMVQVMFPAPITVMPHLKSGRLIGLAVTTTHRVKLLPDLPTLQEAGLAGYEFSSWYGLMAPRDVPPAIVAQLHKAAIHAMGTAAVQKRLVDDATDPVGNTPEQFNRFLGEEFERYSKLVKAMNLKIE
jgi:tripartite-type tricarboxylate transporter receptor subunit TctC